MACNKPIKIGQPLWNELLTAGEDVGWAVCMECETFVSGHPELYDENPPEIRCEACDIGTLEPTGDLIICGEIVELTDEQQSVILTDDDPREPLLMDDTPLSMNIVETLENVFCDLQYDELYNRYMDEIDDALNDDDLDVHHDALRLMKRVLDSYAKHLN